MKWRTRREGRKGSEKKMEIGTEGEEFHVASFAASTADETPTTRSLEIFDSRKSKPPPEIKKKLETVEFRRFSSPPPFF